MAENLLDEKTREQNKKRTPRPITPPKPEGASPSEKPAAQAKGSPKVVKKSGACLVVLSGGQDSTTCLFWARQRYEGVHAITFDYGQRHLRELQAAERVANLAGVLSYGVIALGGDTLHSTSPLSQQNHNQKVGNYAGAEELPGGIEPTFVPMRNMLFLTVAANRAVELKVTDIITGVCQEDFGGYPDCRRVFIDAMEEAINLALGTKVPTDAGSPDAINIITPLMDLTKADSVRLAQTIPDCLPALAFTHTCYEGKYPPSPHNHASILRAKGFNDVGIGDPLILRAKREGALPEDYPDSGYVTGTKYALKQK